jgi:hypothetical protein
MYSMKVQFISSLTAAAIIHIHFPEKGGYQLNSLTPYTVRIFSLRFPTFPSTCHERKKQFRNIVYCPEDVEIIKYYSIQWSIIIIHPLHLKR